MWPALTVPVIVSETDCGNLSGTGGSEVLWFEIFCNAKLITILVCLVFRDI